MAPDGGALRTACGNALRLYGECMMCRGMSGTSYWGGPQKSSCMNQMAKP